MPILSCEMDMALRSMFDEWEFKPQVIQLARESWLATVRYSPYEAVLWQDEHYLVYKIKSQKVKRAVFSDTKVY